MRSIHKRKLIAAALIIFFACSLAIGACLLKAINDQATTDKTTPITIKVLSNDQSITQGTIVRAVLPPSHGKAAISADKKSVIYYPNRCGCGPCKPYYCGPDEFTYIIMDPANPTCISKATVYKRERTRKFSSVDKDRRYSTDGIEAL